jgi:hypothetical protein
MQAQGCEVPSMYTAIAENNPIQKLEKKKDKKT